MNLARREINSNTNSFVNCKKVMKEVLSGESVNSHCLIVLSEKQFSRMSSNSIILEGLNEDLSCKKVFYETVTYGNNVIKARKSFTSLGIKYQWDTLLLSRMSGGYLSILCKKDEALNNNPHLLIVDGSSQQVNNVGDTVSYKPSGMLVLCLMKHQRDNIQPRCPWGKNDSVFLALCKNNTITPKLDHFGSTGKCHILAYVFN